MNRRVLFIVISVALAGSALGSYRRRHLGEKVEEAELIVIGVATAEGKRVPIAGAAYPRHYRHQCRVVVKQVLWPEGSARTNDIVIRHDVYTNHPASWWNYNNTTGVFFFVETSTLVEQYRARMKHKLRGQDMLNYVLAGIGDDWYGTNEWFRLPRFDGWYESVTNVSKIRELIEERKKQ